MSEIKVVKKDSHEHEPVKEQHDNGAAKSKDHSHLDSHLREELFRSIENCGKFAAKVAMHDLGKADQKLHDSDGACLPRLDITGGEAQGKLGRLSKAAAAEVADAAEVGKTAIKAIERLSHDKELLFRASLGTGKVDAESLKHALDLDKPSTRLFSGKERAMLKALEEDLQSLHKDGVISKCGEFLKDALKHLSERSQTEAKDNGPNKIGQASLVSLSDFSAAANLLFDRLDVGHKGYLSKHDLAASMQDSSIKGQDAQLLAAMYRQYDSLHNLSKTNESGITRVDLQSCAQLISQPTRSKQKQDLVNGISFAMLRTAEAQTGDCSSDLYRDPSHPESCIKLDDVRQGTIGDCYFLASLASLAKNHPEQIANMIHSEKDGSYTVIFPGDAEQKAYNVKAPTEAELGLYNHGNADGSWVSVLEKAWGKYRQDHGYAQAPEDPTDGSGGGGWPGTAMEVLSAKKVESLNPSQIGDPELIAMINSSCHSAPYMLITASTPGESDKEKTVHNLVADHCYTVMGVTPDGNGGYTVTVRNPWGGADAIRQVPLSQFKSEFCELAVQRRQTPDA